jgi:putative transposase
MPRIARSSSGGFTYQFLDRGNARSQVCHKDDDHGAFLAMMAEATLRHPIRILAYCLMPNHFQLTVWPHADGDLSRWMHWLLSARHRLAERGQYPHV